MSSKPLYFEPEVLAWLEACSAPASLQLNSNSNGALNVLGNAYSSRVSVLRLQPHGLGALQLQAGPDTLLLLFRLRGVVGGSCGGRPLLEPTEGLIGCLFPAERLQLNFQTPTVDLMGMQLSHALLTLVCALNDKPTPSPTLLSEVLDGFELALVPMLEAFVRRNSANLSANQRQKLQRLEAAVVSTMVRLMPDQGQGSVPRQPGEALGAASAREYCQRAERVMRSNLQRKLSLDSLAIACGCSKRTLQLAFRDSHDCTPMQHLQRLRLTCMREQLLLGASISEACRVAGLSADGRTAGYYRQQFGELPSTTVQTVRQKESQPSASLLTSRQQ